MLVAVRRVGTRFDGKYCVHIVKHNISTLWDTHLDVVRGEFKLGSGMLKSSRPIIPKREEGELVGGPFFDLPLTEEAGGGEGESDVEAEG